MANKETRFEKAFSQYEGGFREIATEIWVDKVTGVNYLYHRDGYSGGLTVLLDSEGKPVVTK